MATTDRLLLASGSPRRRELMAKLGVPFEILEPSGIDESSVSGPARELCRRLAALKARWGLENYLGDREGLWVVGSDTVVVLRRGSREDPLGKPSGRDDARRMLTALSGRSHRVLTGVAVARSGTETRSGVESSEVRFRELTAAEIDAYLDTGDAEGKAGAYGIQSHGRQLVAGFRGCYYNIVGLPLTRLARLLPPSMGIRWTCDCDRHPLQQGGRACGEPEAED